MKVDDILFYRKAKFCFEFTLLNNQFYLPWRAHGRLKPLGDFPWHISMIWVWAKNRWPHSSAVGMMPWGCSIATWAKIQIKIGRHGYYIYAVLSIAPRWLKDFVFENLENSECLHGMPGRFYQNKLRRIHFSRRKYVRFNCSKFNWAMNFLTILTKNSFLFIILEKKKCALEIKR